MTWDNLRTMSEPERQAFLRRQEKDYLEDNLFSDASMADPQLAQLIIDELHRREAMGRISRMSMIKNQSLGPWGSAF
jgi:hypothetical protein